MKINKRPSIAPDLQLWWYNIFLSSSRPERKTFLSSSRDAIKKFDLQATLVMNSLFNFMLQLKINFEFVKTLVNLLKK